jgi:hypothetical protein
VSLPLDADPLVVDAGLVLLVLDEAVLAVCLVPLVVLNMVPNRNQLSLTIYAPAIYTAPCIMFWMRAYTLRGEMGGGWALEFPSFLGPVKWERAG